MSRTRAGARGGGSARRRGTEPSLPFGPGRWTSLGLLEMCGACHRHPSRARPGQIRRDDPYLARFQPVGLMQSRCFVQSQGALNCVSCHDPHARVSSDRGAYDVKCLECHSRAVRAVGLASELPDAGDVCPVSPRERCVECHMPRVESGQHVLFTDHWIRIRVPGENPATAHSDEDERELSTFESP